MYQIPSGFLSPIALIEQKTLISGERIAKPSGGDHLQMEEGKRKNLLYYWERDRKTTVGLEHERSPATGREGGQDH